MTDRVLKKLITFQTVTFDIEKNLHALVFLQKTLKKKHIIATIIEIRGRPMLIWGVQPNNAVAIIMAHIDVVPAKREQFHSHVVGNILSGRGAADTKAAIAVLASLGKKHVQTAINHNTIFCVTTDEEIGGDSAKQLILKKLPLLKFGIFLEPTNLSVVHCSKGIIQLELRAKGVPAHGSRPWEGKNAIMQLIRAIERMTDLNQSPSDTSSTITCTKIEGGEAINQVPSMAGAFFDVRIDPQDDWQKLLEKIRSVALPCDLHVIKQEPALNTDPKNQHVEQFLKAVGVGGGKPELRFEPGASDARHCMQRNIPAVVFGPTGGNLHGNTEWVDLTSLEPVRKTLIAFITNRVQ